MIAAINIMVLLPNHIRKFMNPTSDLVPRAEPRKSIGFFIHPSDIKIELTGPFVENIVKNNIANADAMMRFGR